MRSRSPTCLDQSLAFSLMMPAYWLAFVVASVWMAGQILPIRPLWWMEAQDWDAFETKLTLRIQLAAFFGFFCLFTGIWAHAAIARIRGAGKARNRSDPSHANG
jgi:hypothetical protein